VKSLERFKRIFCYSKRFRGYSFASYSLRIIFFTNSNVKCNKGIYEVVLPRRAAVVLEVDTI